MGRGFVTVAVAAAAEIELEGELEEVGAILGDCGGVPAPSRS